jgi:hypothetical protein
MRAVDGVYTARSVFRHSHVNHHVTWTWTATSKHETVPLYSQTNKIDFHVKKIIFTTPKK